WIVGAVAWACLCASVLSVAQQSTAKKTPAAAAAPAAGARSFDTPQQAANVLVDAAEKFDVVALGQIFGPGGEDIVFSGEFAQDRQHAASFVAEAHEKKSVSVNPKIRNRAFLLVGNEDWPFPLWREAANGSLMPRPADRNSSTAASALMNWTPFQSATATSKRSMITPSRSARVTT